MIGTRVCGPSGDSGHVESDVSTTHKTLKVAIDSFKLHTLPVRITTVTSSNGKLTVHVIPETGKKPHQHSVTIMSNRQ